MWNNTDTPLAYLITFRCYGTWLHGDERGSIDRFHNRYQSPYLPPDKQQHDYNTNKLISEPVMLNAASRSATESAVCETCAKRNWQLYAVNVRTNHAHAVVAMGVVKPDMALSAFKANATRWMREHGCWTSGNTPWAAKGSKRYLWTEHSVQRAVDYVMSGQGGLLPDFND